MDSSRTDRRLVVTGLLLTMFLAALDGALHMAFWLMLALALVALSWSMPKSAPGQMLSVPKGE